MSSLGIGSVIQEILLSSVPVTDKVNDRIFPVLAQEDTEYPFVVYQRSGMKPAYTKDRYSVEDTLYVNVAIISEKYVESLEIAECVLKSLERKKGTFAGLKITDIRLADSSENGEDVFIQGLSFEITINNE